MNLLISLLFAGVAAASECCSSCVNPEAHPSAVIDTGAVAGTVTSLPDADIPVNKFLGIPFAKPPTRFAHPEPAESWGDRILDAREYKPSCVQRFTGNETQREWYESWANTPPPIAGESEDCLTINVFAPATESDELKPVLFWIFGGSFQFGTGSWAIYDGTSFVANHDLLVVTFNYRTNVFGFPGSPELPDDHLNLGFYDSRLALDWVQRNIAAFGGDPEKVTIFGNSAGAGTVDTLILAPPDPLPFRAAIMQSAQATFVAPGGGDPSLLWNATVEAVGCSEEESALECMLEVSAQELRDVVQLLPGNFNAIHSVDESSWPANPRVRRLNSTEESSVIARVPVLVGSNDDEGQNFVYFDDTSAADFLRGLDDSITDEIIEAILAFYPIGSPDIPNEREQKARIQGEISFHCPAYGVAAESAEVGIPSWRYYFNATFPNYEIYDGSGAFHAAELKPIFGTYDREGATPEQHEISKAMQKAWADFAKDPTSGPGWEQVPAIGVFGAGDDGKETFDTVDSETLDFRCKFWLDQLAPRPEGY